MISQSASTHGRFVWHDLMTTDVARAEKFYVDLFGWRIEETRTTGTPYRMIHCGAVPMGGLTATQRASQWMPHVAVANVDRTAKQGFELGGSTRVKPTEIPSVGRFAVLADPLGETFSIFSRAPKAPVADPDLTLPGGACWSELLTRDDVKAMQYYEKLFGWKDAPKDIGPLGVYHVQKLGDKRVCGIMKNPMNGAPDAWLVYFHAPELGAATDKAARLGAKAFVSNMPIPDVGAFSMFSDPTGAMFALFEPSLSART